MFCYKCGNQLPEDALFCIKCGTKVVDEDTDKRATDTSTVEHEQRTDILEEALHQDAAITDNHNIDPVKDLYDNGDDFRHFVNDYVRKNTHFQSAEELLGSKVTNRFIQICYGFPAIFAVYLIISLLAQEGLSKEIGMTILASVLVAFLMGYLAVHIVGALKKTIYASNFSGEIDDYIKADELIQFLNESLNYLSPYFHEWGYLEQTINLTLNGVPIAKMDLTSNSEIALCTEFGEKKTFFSVIYISPDVLNRDSGKLKYICDIRIKSADIRCEKYACIVKTAPILQAAIEYYLREYKTERKDFSGKSLGESQEKGIDIRQPVISSSIKSVNDQTHGVKKNASKRRKKLPVISGIAVLIAIAVIVVVLNWEGKVDYIATVKAHTPFTVPYTYEEVLNKYMVSPEWEVREDGNIHYVDIEGTIKGTDSKLTITIAVSPHPNNPDKVLMNPELITVNGEKLLLQEDAVDFLGDMFFMYDEGYEDIACPNTESSSPLIESNIEYKMAYAEKVKELVAEDGTTQFSLIDLTGRNVPELVAEHYGYDVSVFSWVDEEIVTLMDQWPYGVGGNQGYEYLPGNKVIRNYSLDCDGAIIYEYCMTVNDAYEIAPIDEGFSIWYFRDNNENGWPDEDEYSEEPVYYYGDTEISEEDYARLRISGDFERITGELSAEEILAQLEGNDIS